jgi:hypothetical protein
MSRRKYRQPPATATRQFDPAIVAQVLKVRAELDQRPVLAPADLAQQPCTKCKRRYPESFLTRWVSNPRPDGTYAVQLFVCLNCSSPKPKPYPSEQVDSGASRGKPAWNSRSWRRKIAS